MITYQESTRTFHLVSRRAEYVISVDEQGRLIHCWWGPRPAHASTNQRLSGEVLPKSAEFHNEVSTQAFEFTTHGDVAGSEASLDLAFPGDWVLARRPGDATDTRAIRDVRLRYQSHRVVDQAEPGLAPAHGRPTLVEIPRQTLIITLRDALFPFEVDLCYRLTPEHDIIERWVVLRNLGPTSLRVETLDFATLNLPFNCDELTILTGIWGRETTSQRETLGYGYRALESRDIRSSGHANAAFLMNRPGQAWEETGQVYFGTLAYSGNWRLSFQQLISRGIRVFGGYHPADLELTLAPGGSHVTPAFIIGVSDAGWGRASRRLHRLARGRILPGPISGQTDAYRPVLYNGWEASYFDLKIDEQIALARQAASIGVELFCIDDGWFGDRRSAKAGLGDWWPSPDLFPHGLTPLIDEVKRLGMVFGLWIEPEMVNPDSKLYREHPDWVLHYPGRPRVESRLQLILDLARNEVMEYLFAHFDRLLVENDIGFLKLDSNRPASEAGSVAGREIWRRHTERLYDLIDRLRAKHPRLAIETCASGGSRVDYGMFARTEQSWPSDNTDPYDRIRIQEGYSLFFPAQTMMAWITHEQNHQTGRHSTLKLRADVAMRGGLGIGNNLTAMNPEEMAALKAYVAFYKRIRPVVQGGDLYRLERLEEGEASILQYVAADASAAVYSVAVKDHLVCLRREARPLQALDPAATYVISNYLGRVVLRMKGYDLMTIGIPGDGEPGPVVGSQIGYSTTLFLQRE